MITLLIIRFIILILLSKTNSFLRIRVDRRFKKPNRERNRVSSESIPLEPKVRTRKPFERREDSLVGRWWSRTHQRDNSRHDPTTTHLSEPIH